MKNNFLKVGFIFILILGVLNSKVSAEVFDSIYTDEIHMLKGELVTVGVYSLTRLSLTNPDIADIVEATENEILVVAQQEGETTLFIWDKHGKRALTFHVAAQDLKVAKKRLEQLLKTINIQGIKVLLNESEGKLVVLGDILEHEKENFDQVVDSFGDIVINLVKEEEIQDLIQLDLQITELSTSLTKSLGIDWSTGASSSAASTNTTSSSRSRSSGSFSPSYAETLPDFDGSIKDFFKIGQFSRSTSSAITAKITALLEEGKARILSQPKLVVISGEEASFLVGGEIPIRTTTSSAGGSTQENVSFKSYGISMTLTPEIKKEKIDISLNVEVSDVDAANAVGNDVAFSTRSASTHLYLDDGQMIILAGLIKHNRATRIKKIPFVSSIPIVGLLFRSKSMPTPDLDQELVISLTPHILEENRNDSFQERIVKKVNEKSDKIVIKQKQMTPALLPYYSGIPKEMTEYVRGLQKKIASSVVYPQRAEYQSLEGTVKLGILILKDGTLAYALVKESSGYELFDEDALSVARAVAPYESFPTETTLQELNVVIPIVYKSGN